MGPAAPPGERMRPVDPRLLRYARASRSYFALIAVLGAAQTVVIVAIAWLLTRAITGVIDGMPPPELATTLTWLVAAIVARAVLLWLREWASARAATRVEAQLRAGLVEAVGRLGPGWLATRNSAQLAVTAGRGLDALDAYFGRYLPQLVLTVIATPVIVLVMWSQDWISGLTVLLTLPLIPIFMVLIGLATRAVQQRQWQTLRRLAARFSDTVHGLSTLKVFGRQGRAAASIERVTDDYRRETMRVLRVSFLSGFALEFLASISVAIIAVSIGFRLLDGDLRSGSGCSCCCSRPRRICRCARWASSSTRPPRVSLRPTTSSKCWMPRGRSPRRPTSRRPTRNRPNASDARHRTPGLLTRAPGRPRPAGRRGPLRRSDTARGVADRAPRHGDPHRGSERVGQVECHGRAARRGDVVGRRDVRRRRPHDARAPPSGWRGRVSRAD